MTAIDGGITVGIEAAIEGGSLVLFREAAEVDAIVGEIGISRAEDILPNLDQLLRRNDLHREQIEKIVVSTGPGSFTGIKIGISTAMGLADGLGCSAVGMSALDAMAYVTKTEEKTLTAVPIGRDFVAAQHFHISAGNLIPVSSPKLLTELRLIEELKGLHSSAIVYSGLVQRLEAMGATNLISVNRNIASLIVRAEVGRKATKNIAPLFIDRKPLAVAS